MLYCTWRQSGLTIGLYGQNNFLRGWVKMERKLTGTEMKSAGKGGDGYNFCPGAGLYPGLQMTKRQNDDYDDDDDNKDDMLVI